LWLMISWSSWYKWHSSSICEYINSTMMLAANASVDPSRNST
jgi:hypothetical protein